MSYTLSIALLLGASHVGIEQQLQGQLFNTAGDVPGLANSTFKERGNKGTYLWTGDIPDGFQGGLEVEDLSTGTVLTVVAINPQEAEYIDVRVSSRLGLSTSMTELTGPPPATPTIQEALMLLYMALRNQLDTTATELLFRNGEGDVIARAALADDGIKFIRAQMTAP